MSIPEHILTLIDNNAVDDAIVSLDRLIDSQPDNDEAFFLRGKLHWQLGQRKNALNDYHRAAELNPGGPAAGVIEMTMSIMNFYNKDLYNP